MQSQIKLENILIHTESLPSLPEILIKLNEVVNNPFSSFDDFAEIIEKDTSLTARVLKIVNSPFYGFPKKIDSVFKACSLLGSQQIMNIVISTKIIDTFGGIERDFVDMKSFWKHSILTGSIAKTTSTILQEINPESYFVSGLLHDIGRILFLKAYPDVMRDIIYRSRTQNILLWKLEQEIFGFDHAKIGGILLNKWRFPSHQQDNVMFHHYPSASQFYKKQCAVIHISNIIARVIGPHSSGDFFITPLDKIAFESLNLNEHTITFIINKSEELFEEIVSYFLDDED
jgi:HD-like signal output (HDOD) protein